MKINLGQPLVTNGNEIAARFCLLIIVAMSIHAWWIVPWQSASCGQSQGPVEFGSMFPVSGKAAAQKSLKSN